MQDLQEVTQEVHYENYRSERLAKSARKGNGHLAKEESFTDGINGSDKDRILLEKEAELRKMQEMLILMQAKIQAQQ